METNGNGTWKGAAQSDIRHALEDIGRLEARIVAYERGELCKDWRSDMEKRLRSVEAFRWQMIGALLLINGIGVGVILAAIRAWAK